MSELCIYLNFEKYIAEWVLHTFGDPVILIKDSPELRVLNELLVKRPNGSIDMTEEEENKESNVRIVLPYFKGKDPRTYNYLYKSGQNALQESFRTLLIKNLIEEVGSIDNGSMKIASLIYAWMEKHGVDQSCSDTIWQIYYRARKRYFDNCDIRTR